MLTLITGGARSGKSRFAQTLCGEAKRVVYIATALASDTEMQARISDHRRSRPPGWHTVEEPIKVPEAVAVHVKEADVVLVDCLTIWLSNLLYELHEKDGCAVEREAIQHVTYLIETSAFGNIVAVTNEVGSGIVPGSAVGRQFRDVQGLVNQKMALAADAVYFMVSGIPNRIKPAGRSVAQ